MKSVGGKLDFSFSFIELGDGNSPSSEQYTHFLAGAMELLSAHGKSFVAAMLNVNVPKLLAIDELVRNAHGPHHTIQFELPHLHQQLLFFVDIETDGTILNGLLSPMN